MYGSGPDDGDVLAMGPEKPPRGWAIGARTRRVMIAAGVCVLLAAGGTVAAVRLSAPTDPALAKLVTEVTTVPLRETVPSPASTVVIMGNAGPGSGNPDTQSPPNSQGTGSLSLPAPTYLPPVDLWTSPANAGPALTAGGKPEVLYVNNGYCPYCVAENWSLIVALSRFGTFSGLSTSRSPAFEGVPPIDGWTFYGSTFASRYLTFTPVELHSNVLVSPKANPGTATSYRVRQRLTPGQQAVVGKLDPQQETPFLDVGGKTVLIGFALSPTALANLSWNQIAADLRQPQSQAGMTILDAASTLTTELCKITGDRPAAACPH
jgi:hypothetical protein